MFQLHRAAFKDSECLRAMGERSLPTAFHFFKAMRGAFSVVFSSFPEGSDSFSSIFTLMDIMSGRLFDEPSASKLKREMEYYSEYLR